MCILVVCLFINYISKREIETADRTGERGVIVRKGRHSLYSYQRYRGVRVE